MYQVKNKVIKENCCVIVKSSIYIYDSMEIGSLQNVFNVPGLPFHKGYCLEGSFLSFLLKFALK